MDADPAGLAYRVHMVRGGLRRLLVVALLAMAAVPTAARASIDVGALAQMLGEQPVQVVGQPSLSLSPAEVSSLRAEINNRDPGRIWVAVVPSMSQPATSKLSNGLSGYLNANGGGTVIVVAGAPVWASTSWEDGSAATARLAAAFEHNNHPLVVQLRQAIDSFASGDDAAGHPQLGGATTSTSQGPSNSAGPLPANSGGGTSVGLIVVLVAAAVALLAALIVLVPRARASRRSAHRRSEEAADARAQVQADFGKLGDQISSLDIDSSMPNASLEGKAEYGKAIECYQDAERRLKTPHDQYQYERAVAAIKQGLEHVQAADRLFNPTSGSIQ
jgi:hypothetical protein